MSSGATTICSGAAPTLTSAIFFWVAASITATISWSVSTAYTSESSRLNATEPDAFEYVADTLTELPDDKVEEVDELIAALESDDDVQNVYSNLA